MKKKLIAVVLVTIMTVGFTACGSSSSTAEDRESESTTVAATEAETPASYESILNEYDQKMADATPGLVEVVSTFTLRFLTKH